MDRDFVLSLFSDKGSARSMQKAVGPSEIGGCRRRIWSRLVGAQETNPDTLSMAAFMGTAIHSAIEKKIKRRDDPFDPRFQLEVEVEYDGIRGHVDCYDMQTYEVIDWKTITKRKASSFPSGQQRTQVHIYGYLLMGLGHRVDTVTLVGIPRDGNELDVVVHSEPYSEQIALDGIAWLRDIENNLDVIPEPEMPKRFCRDYCQFYDASGDIGCPSMG